MPLSEICNCHLNDYFDKEVKMVGRDLDACRDYARDVIKQLVYNIHVIDPLFSSKPVHIGSSRDGLKVIQGDEYDVNVPMVIPSECKPALDNTLNQIKRLNGAALRGARHEDKTSPGYVGVRLSVIPPAMKKLVHDSYLSPSLVRQRFRQALSTAIKRTLIGGRSCVGYLQLTSTGPAERVVLNPSSEKEISTKIYIDFAPSIHLNASKELLKWWPILGAKDGCWPETPIKKEVRSLGINLVAKRDYGWYVSYAEGESRLVLQMLKDVSCRKQALRILKTLNTQDWSRDGDALISSYILKNALFWECFRKPSDTEWQPPDLADRVRDLLVSLEQSVRYGHMPMFFNPEVNLLVDVPDEALQQFLACLQRFKQSPLSFLCEGSHWTHCHCNSENCSDVATKAAYIVRVLSDYAGMILWVLVALAVVVVALYIRLKIK